MQVLGRLGPIGHRLARVLLHLDVVELPAEFNRTERERDGGGRKQKRGMISKCPTKGYVSYYVCLAYIMGDDMFVGVKHGEWRNCGKWENCRPRYIFYKPPPLFFAVALFTLFPVVALDGRFSFFGWQQRKVATAGSKAVSH